MGVRSSLAYRNDRRLRRARKRENKLPLDVNLLFQRSPLNGYLCVIRQAQINRPFNRWPFRVDKLPVLDVLIGKAA